MSETVGRQLRRERERRGLSLEQVAGDTHLRVHNLEALEEGNFEALPSNTQGRGMLRIYAGYLNLDAHALLSELEDGVRPRVSAPPPEPEPPDAQVETSPEQVNLVFSEIGDRLRLQRELVGLSLEDVERHTRLKMHYLIALESGDLDQLPSPVQGRGMLANYASFLGLDPEPLLLSFADGLQTRHAARRAGRIEKSPPAASRPAVLPWSVRRLLSLDLILGGAALIFILGFVIWGASQIIEFQAGQTPTATAPSIAEVLLASPTVTNTFTPEPVTPTAALVQQQLPTFPVPTGLVDNEQEAPQETLAEGEEPVERIQVYLTVHQRAWVRVIVDGETQLEGRVQPYAFSFEGGSQVELLTGNGAGIQVFFNQSDLGLLGFYGEVVHRVYTQQGPVLPTATQTLTPTITFTPTRTPLVTETPQTGEATVPSNP